MNYNRTFLIIIFLLVILVTISGVPVQLIANAAKYAQVSREIAENNEWINLTIGGDAYEQKPPLLFWIGALVFKIFGMSVITYKIPVILISFLGIYSLYRLASLLYDRKTGLLAAIFWSTSLGYLHFHNDIHTDTLLATVVIFSLWQLTAFFSFKKWHQFILGITGVGLAMLTKGPVGLAIPALAIGTDLLWKRKYSEIFHWRWLLALVLIGLIILPALMGLLNQFGIQGIKFYFWTNNVGRITGSYYGTNNDIFFYLHTSVYMLAPWTILAITGLILEIREFILTRGKSGRDGNAIFLGAVMPYLIVLSIAKTKNPHYMMAVAPFMLALGAKWAIHIYDSVMLPRLKKIFPNIHRGIVILLWMLIMVPGIFVFPEKRMFFWIVIAIMLAGSFYFMILKSNLQRQVIMLAITLSAFLFMVNVNLLPNMLKFQSSFQAAEIFNREAGDNATLNIYGEEARLWELFLHSKRPGKYLITPEDLKNYLPKEGAWFYTGETSLKEMEEMGFNIEIVNTFKHKTLTKQRIKFLNPKTREANFKKMYLVKIL